MGPLAAAQQPPRLPRRLSLLAAYAALLVACAAQAAGAVKPASAAKPAAAAAGPEVTLVGRFVPGPDNAPARLPQASSEA